MRSILLPYSIDSSYSNVNSGIILRRIREPSSDFINPVALCKALNVLSTSLSFLTLLNIPLLVKGHWLVQHQ